MTGSASALRIAAWSGPRNISTAMMRAWENRGDTSVIDEPFYGCYLSRTGLKHPGREAVIASQGDDWRAVVGVLTGPVPGGKRVFYQKHMAHHLLDDMSGPWLDRMSHVFLIREPARMLVSLDRVTPGPDLADTGLPQQVQILERARRRTGETPPVIDARDVLEAPREMLKRLCARLDLPFSERMLCWPAGPRESDGVWAPHWYGRVLESTGFDAPTGTDVEVPRRLTGLLSECEEIYDTLYALRLRPG